MNKKPPRIGIVLDHEPSGGYSKFPWYALRENYFTSLISKGAVCFALPYDGSSIPTYIDLMDGLVIAGGHFDLSPALYGDSRCHPTISIKEQRTGFEWDLVHRALDQDLPVLGICGGMQLLNVLLGGTLIQHLPEEIPGCLEHEQPTPRDTPFHSIRILEDTFLHQWTGHRHMDVNSAHHQAVKTVGPEVRVNAYAPDGVIEGIESLKHKFCLGVQWHPEFLLHAGDHVLMESFLKACATHSIKS